MIYKLFLDGQYCPEKAGTDVGICLKEQGDSKLSAACKDYIKLHEICAADIASHCLGKEFTGTLHQL